MKLKAYMSLVLLFLVASSFLTSISNGISTSRLTDRLISSSNYLTTTPLWFNQSLDHFSPYDHRKFAQRYYEYIDNFRIPDGPIFLQICGESACRGIVNDYIGVLAKKFGAAVVSLEHRYYGESSPFQYFTTENLKYLSSNQALFDLAVFRQYYQETLNVKLNKSSVENPWFVFGTSYSGALSAWFRLKFPHLTCGSLSSSGVVLAVYNFTEFDQQIGESAGSECKAVLQEITTLVDQRLASDRSSLKKLFDAAELKIDGDFLYFLADAAAIAFQYGNPDKLCSPLIEAKKAGEDLVSAYAKYVKEYYVKSFGVSTHTYNQKYLKDTSNDDRLWWFQVCTEVAYFQIAPANDSIRSSKIDTKYHLDLCKNVFGEGIYPKVDATNLYYGGTKIAGTKIVFTNGSQDPWRHASKQTSSPDSRAENVSYTFKYTGGADSVFRMFNALSQIAFAYAGHAVTLEIQATMPSTPEKPSRILMFKGVVGAYIITAICYWPVALIGYYAFGKDVADNVLENLEKPSWLIAAANLMVVIHVIGSYQKERWLIRSK